MKILKNPYIKFLGIGAILYFALFSNKSNPDSLGNRLSKENIKNNISNAQKQVGFISTTIKEQKEELKKRQEEEKPLAPVNKP